MSMLTIETISFRKRRSGAPHSSRKYQISTRLRGLHEFA